LIEVSREAVAIAPNSFDNHLTLAGAYQLAGDFDRAKHEYEICYKLRPGHPALTQARKSFHLAVVQSPMVSPVMLAGTIQKIQDNLFQNPNDPELLYLYGRGKEAQGDRETATKAYQAAANINPLINPDLKPALRRLGAIPPEVSNQTAQTGSASQATTPRATPLSLTSHTEEKVASTGSLANSLATSQPKAIEKPKNNEALTLIKTKLAGGDVEGAQKDLLVLVDKEPTNGEAWKILGQNHEKKGNLEEAQVCYRQSNDLKEPGADSLLAQVSALRIQPLIADAQKQEKDGNLVGAKSCWSEAVNLAPNLSLPHRRLSDILKKLGDTKESEREANKAAELDKK
jgi:Flp pilus assembly protein TadD